MEIRVRLIRVLPAGFFDTIDRIKCKIVQKWGLRMFKMAMENKYIIKNIFENWWDSLIQSSIEGCMGEVWVNNNQNVKSSIIINSSFCFLAGEPDEKMLLEMPDRCTGDFMVLVPIDKGWDKLIEKHFADNIRPVTRYAIKKEDNSIFDVEYLSKIIYDFEKSNLNSCKDNNQNEYKKENKYQLVMINEEETVYRQALKEEWSEDICINFKDFSDYRDRGIGVGILCNGKLVAGASSYTVYPGGIEVTIHTKDDCQKKGFASVCGARLIIECIKRNLYPSWDARTMISVHLAEKLGYHFKCEYKVYDYILTL